MDDENAEVDESDVEEVVAYVRYQIDCGHCGCVVELEEDPAGETVECDLCGGKNRVRETL